MTESRQRIEHRIGARPTQSDGGQMLLDHDSSQADNVAIALQ